MRTIADVIESAADELTEPILTHEYDQEQANLEENIQSMPAQEYMLLIAAMRSTSIMRVLSDDALRMIGRLAEFRLAESVWRLAQRAKDGE